MGEARKDALKLDCDRRSELEFHVTKVTSDADLLAHAIRLKGRPLGTVNCVASRSTDCGDKWDIPNSDLMLDA